MNDLEIRIAIAEACPDLFSILRIPDTAIVWKHNGKITDPLNDLNAMHEAEKTLTGTDRRKFAGILVEMIAGYEPRDSTTRISLVGICNIAHATARQRAEAFLRTIGKWKEST